METLRKMAFYNKQKSHAKLFSTTRGISWWFYDNIYLHAIPLTCLLQKKYGGSLSLTKQMILFKALSWLLSHDTNGS